MATKISPEEFVDALQEWSVLDVVNAVKLMEEKLGIKAAAPVAVAAAPAGGGGREGSRAEEAGNVV
jgi:large subunit ribosomal protein L7/L12